MAMSSTVNDRPAPAATKPRLNPPRRNLSSAFRLRDGLSGSTIARLSTSAQHDERRVARPVWSARTTPQDGDIVVREEQRGESQVYVLHTAPRADQYEFHRREEGIAQAVALARRDDVRAWLTDEGYDFVLLESFREPESVWPNEVRR